MEAKSLGHVTIELLRDAAILTSEVVRVARRCRPKKVRQRGKGNDSKDGWEALHEPSHYPITIEWIRG